MTEFVDWQEMKPEPGRLVEFVDCLDRSETCHYNPRDCDNNIGSNRFYGYFHVRKWRYVEGAA